MNESPNHALQRTAPAVTARASTAAFPPAMHGPRQPPPSLSLGSLGVAARIPRMKSNTPKRIYWKLIAGTLFLIVSYAGLALCWIGVFVINDLINETSPIIKKAIPFLVAGVHVALGAIACDRKTAHPNILYAVSTGYVGGMIIGFGWCALREGWWPDEMTEQDDSDQRPKN